MAPPIKHTINDREWSFPILTPMDLIGLGKTFHKRIDRMEFIAGLKAMGMSIEDMDTRLQRFDLEAGSATAIGHALLKVENALDVIRESMARLPDGQERPPIDDIAIGDLTLLALDLCNFKIARPDPEADPDEANPTKVASHGTGMATPHGSPT